MEETSFAGKSPIKKSFITLLDGEADDLSSEHTSSSGSTSDKSVEVLELDDDVERSPFFELD